MNLYNKTAKEVNDFCGSILPYLLIAVVVLVILFIWFPNPVLGKLFITVLILVMATLFTGLMTLQII